MKIAIIAGIHEDIVSLNKALNLITDHNCEKVFCLGDIVGYAPPYYGYYNSRNASAVVLAIKNSCEYSVAGNHDLFAIKKISENTKYEYGNDWYKKDLYQRVEIGNQHVWTYEDELPALLDLQSLSYLNELPEHVAIEANEKNIMISHYLTPNLLGDSKFFVKNVDEHLELMKKNKCDLAFYSHEFIDGGKLWFGNSCVDLRFGSHNLSDHNDIIIGIPWIARGTSPNGFAILDTKSQLLEIIPLSDRVHVLPEWFKD